ncbi:MAG TPA: hydrogenase nickel incorporation protein HypB [Candidatus Sulfomarinibacteraceae bacterium]|nr:hydrogenase nickel incorporation protein HypB [Candidatus Sulfomarinibacteraceae bacterium]
MKHVVTIRRKALEASEEHARKLRARFAEDRTLVLNLISSPGSGKTTLLEQTARRLADRLRLAVIEGDVATERDADRIRALGVPAHQVLTGGACHLDARQIETALETAALLPADILFIENVGNLICPTTYDLGEDFKVALLSVTEGDDKPFKYPAIFSRAEVTVITKADLLPHVPFDLEAVRDHVASLNPAGALLIVSSTTGDGMDDWCELLLARLAGKRGT